MPRLTEAEAASLSRSATPDDIVDDIPASIPPTQTQADDAAEEQLEQELVDTTTEMPSAKKGKGSRKQKAEKVAEPVNGDAEEEAEFEVESIVGHIFNKKTCLYKVRWKNYSEADDTYEPEDHLLPESSDILAEYHKKIGGTPQAPKQVRKAPSKAALKEATPEEESDADKPNSNKRQKRSHRTTATKNNNLATDSKQWQAEPLGSWQPSDKGSWEDLVHSVETVERDDLGNLHAFIRFNNGRRSKVANNIYTSRCPRAMLRFYEGHLNFQTIGAGYESGDTD